MAVVEVSVITIAFYSKLNNENKTKEGQHEKNFINTTGNFVFDEYGYRGIC